MNYLVSDPSTVFMVAVSAVGIYLGLIVLTRLAGLRSFSKMSSFDFAMTVAIGSLVASTIASPTPSLLQGLVALASVFLLQWLVGRWRVRRGARWHPVDNEPLILMDGHRMLEENMSAARVTRGDLVAKLREANVLNVHQVRAVVMETTGDISVLHSSDPREEFDAGLLLEDVRRKS